jgi:hypothetical protein
MRAVVNVNLVASVPLRPCTAPLVFPNTQYNMNVTPTCAALRLENPDCTYFLNATVPKMRFVNGPTTCNSPTLPSSASACTSLEKGRRVDVPPPHKRASKKYNTLLSIGTTFPSSGSTTFNLFTFPIFLANASLRLRSSMWPAAAWRGGDEVVTRGEMRGGRAIVLSRTLARGVRGSFEGAGEKWGEAGR